MRRESDLKILTVQTPRTLVVVLAGELHLGDEVVVNRLPVGPVEAVVHAGDLHAVGAGGFDAVIAWADKVCAAGGTVELRTASAALDRMAEAMGFDGAHQLLEPYAHSCPSSHALAS